MEIGRFGNDSNISKFLQCCQVQTKVHSLFLLCRDREGDVNTPRRPDKIQYAVSVNWERKQAESGNKKTFCTGNLNDCHSLFCCCARRVGNMFFLCENRSGVPLVVAGPCWPFCTFITFPLVAGLSTLTLYFCILSPNSALVSIVCYSTLND